MKNEVVLEFKIVGFEDVSHEYISKITGVNPAKVFIKGQKRNPSNPNGKALHKNNIWVINASLGKYASFDDQLNTLLEIIESKIEIFKIFSIKYYCEFSCALFIYSNGEESTPWLHLNSRYNRLIKELNIEFDVDIYCMTNNENSAVEN